MGNPPEEDKRLYPRVKTNLKVGISKTTATASNDFSEGGLSLSSEETISSPTVSLRIGFPDKQFEFKVNAKLIWKRNLEKGGSLYGLEFIKLTENQKTELRRELVRIQIQGLLNGIKIPEIKTQVADFFLNDVLNYINEIIKVNLCLSNQTKYSESLERKLEYLHTRILLKGYCLEELIFDKTKIKRIKDNFRQLTGAWIYKSKIVQRAFEKPRGYPGDYKLLEIIYDNKPISKNIGIYFDNNFLKNPYAAAVRIRKDRLKKLLQQYIGGINSNHINILNIACGSCREIQELLPDLKTKSLVTFACLDWDEEALKFSQNKLLSLHTGNLVLQDGDERGDRGKFPSFRIKGAGNKTKNIEVQFIKEDVMSIIKNNSLLKSLGKQNLIYSIGLIDYLPDRVLKKLIYVLYHLLESGGRLILTHKNREKTFPPVFPDWFCDWRFVPRDREEILELFYDCGISGFSVPWESDDFAYTYYFTITKN
ncbi:MAG: PilZ domain-containing protein [Candidatus Omnitrophota bacterium]